MHSLRSTRSYLNRPMSDISYVDEDSTALSPNYYHRNSSASSAAARNNNKGNNSMTNTVGTQYLKVEGTSYRVKSASSTGQGGPKTKNTNTGPVLMASMATQSSADAQTQSAESSFEISPNPSASVSVLQQSTDCYNQQINNPPPCVQIAPAPPLPPQQEMQPPPPQPPRASSPMQVHHQQAVTVQPPHGALQTHLLPSPIYGFGGYDPSYCQYLGQGADGFQYELVRRPSIGQPVELLVPQQPQQHVRRASGGIPYLGPNSMQGSFDSQGPPPSTTPIFIQQPLSPRHLHRSSEWHQPQDLRSGGGGGGGVQQSSGSAGPPPDEIPKLIHETSI